MLVAPPSYGVNFRLGNLRVGLTDMLLLHSVDRPQDTHQPRSLLWILFSLGMEPGTSRAIGKALALYPFRFLF